MSASRESHVYCLCLQCGGESQLSEKTALLQDTNCSLTGDESCFPLLSAALQKTASTRGFCENNQEWAGAVGVGGQTQLILRQPWLLQTRIELLPPRQMTPRDASFEIQSRQLCLRLQCSICSWPFPREMGACVSAPFEVSKENPELFFKKKNSKECGVATEWKAFSVMARL